MKSENMTGLIVFAHGSSVESANEAVRNITAALAQKGGYSAIETAFLEGGKPDLAGATASLVARGIRKVVVLPYFLTLGLHLKRDLPNLIAEVRAAHPDLEIDAAPPLDGHPALVEVLHARAEEAIA